MPTPVRTYAHTEKLLTPENIGIIDIAGRPTITIEDGLAVKSAVNADIDFQPGYAILGHWMVPTPEFREEVLAQPIHEGQPPEELGARYYMRWLGHKAMAQAAAAQGLTDPRDLFRRQLQKKPDDPSFIPPYFKIYDGGVLHDIEGLRDDKIPSWQGIIEQYGAEDELVTDYFAKLEESLRVDAGTLLNYLGSLVKIDLVLSGNDTVRRLAAILDSFLVNQGYTPDRSSVEVVNLEAREA